MSVNKFIGVGYVTKDPVLRYMPNGEAVTNCSIACNEKWKNKAGEKQESVEFINLTFYRRLAEVAGEYLKKGSMIYVEGKITTEKYTDKSGIEKYATKIIVNEMQMLGGKSDSASGNSKGTGFAPEASEPSATPAQPAKSGGWPDSFEDDLIPFN